jgi:hypothetical protein
MNINELNGTYRARAVESGLGKASTGTEQVAVLFELLDENGLRITWYGYFSDKAYEQTVKALRACGWQGADPTELDTFATSGLGSNEVELVIEQETAIDAQGNAKGTRAKVRWVNVPGAGGIGLKSKLAPDEAKSFAARMKAKILALEHGKPKVNGSPSRQPEPPPHGDSDRPPF